MIIGSSLGTADTADTCTIADACQMVRVTPRTLYYWMETGKIDYVVTAGGTRRIVTSTLWRDPKVQRMGR